MVVSQHITTAHELLRAGLGPSELLRGKLVVLSPAGFEHGRIVALIGARLASLVKQQALGVVVAGGTGFQIGRNPDTVRAPDVGFVCAERVSAPPTKGFFPGSPDLAVEVLSPNDRASDLLAKVQDWLGAGCRAVWVIDPATRTVTVYGRPSEMTVYGPSDELTGGEVVPGFKWPVSEIFALP